MTTASGDAMVVDSSGNVGIGAATPAAKLDVNGAVKIGNQSTCDVSIDFQKINFKNQTQKQVFVPIDFR